MLSPFGSVKITLEVPGESQYVDVYFEPSVPPAITPTNLGLLGRIAQTPCLLEPFRNQPTPAEIRSCLLKLYQAHGDYERKARREHERIPENDLPYLWILASSASENLLNGFGVSSNEDWGSGVYFLHPSLRTAIIAINQLPRDETTLLLRLLGKGQTQNQAVDEVIAFDTREPRRAAILRLLANWKISIEITGQVEAEEELMMALTQAYLEWEQQTEQRGEAKGRHEEGQSLILRLLTRRIGDISPDLQAQIQVLSLDQLEALGEALLDFTEPDDLVMWLQGN
ncbi:MAG: DUF4351 domain-containing protein [Acaryochloris sp. CRU_2_0]|nr:DUF4351 domain-containing protein [Acaryochloris sp. CRU_2_0]